jgi:hypothetical protein
MSFDEIQGLCLQLVTKAKDTLCGIIKGDDFRSASEIVSGIPLPLS